MKVTRGITLPFKNKIANPRPITLDIVSRSQYYPTHGVPVNRSVSGVPPINIGIVPRTINTGVSAETKVGDPKGFIDTAFTSKASTKPGFSVQDHDA